MTTGIVWRRNLAALWVAELTAVFGFSFAFPFLPVYLRELGVRDPSQLALWTGIAGGASGLGLAVMGPIWGVVADRHGRKTMLVRAMVGGAITVGLTSLARGPVDLVVLRLLQGATSGTVAAATAIVATGTPRLRVGWALGVLGSAVAVGSALGPLVGGLAATAFGVRAIFAGGGLFLAAAVVPVVIVVRDVPVRRGGERARPAMEVLRQAAPGTVAAVAALLVCQALVQVAYSGYQPLVVLRLLEHLSSGVAAVTGVAFAVSGLAGATASVLYARFARRFGYWPVAVVAALGLGGAVLFTAFAPDAWPIVAATALCGTFYGTLAPAVTSMIGLETPAAAQARVFGFGASATAVGFALGPFGGGLLASLLGTAPALSICAATAGLLALVLALRVREPGR